TQNRNARPQPAADRYREASLPARIHEIPTGQITRAMGDVHPSGNPHYWLDPENGKRIAKEIEGKLAAISPGDATYFSQHEEDFEKRVSDGEQRCPATLAPYKGSNVMNYNP